MKSFTSTAIMLLVLLGLSYSLPQSVQALEIDEQTQSLMVREAEQAFEQALYLKKDEPEQSQRLLAEAYQRMKLVCEQGQPEAADFFRLGNLAWQQSMEAEALSAYLKAQQLEPGQPEIQSGIHQLSRSLEVNRPGAPFGMLWNWMPWWGWASVIVLAWMVGLVMYVLHRFGFGRWTWGLGLGAMPVMLAGVVGVSCWVMTLRTPLVVVIDPMQEVVREIPSLQSGVGVREGEMYRVQEVLSDRVVAVDSLGGRVWLEKSAVELINEE